MNISANQATQIPVAVGNPTTILNTGHGTLYYGRDAQVSQTHNTGSIAPGASVLIEATNYIISIGQPGEFQLIQGEIPGEGSWTNVVIATLGTPANFVPLSDGAGGYAWGASGASPPVTSVFGRAGDVAAVSGDYTVAQVTGAAPTASPAFTGSPTVPNQSPLDNSTKAANTHYVDAAVAAGGGGGGGGTGSNYPSPKNSPYNAKGGAKHFSAGGSHPGSSQWRDTTNHPFTGVGEVGKTIVIIGGGSVGVGGNLPHVTTIATFVDASNITLTVDCPNPGGVTGEYYYGPDDTVAFQALSTAVKGRIEVSYDSYMVTSIDPSPGQFWDGGGSHMYHIPFHSALRGAVAAVFADTTNDGATENDQGEFFNFNFHGAGLLGFDHTNCNGYGGIFLQQWSRARVHHNTYDNFADSNVYYADCQKTETKYNIMTNHGVTSGRNAVVYFDSATGNATATPVCDHRANGNHIETHCAGIVASEGVVSETQDLRANFYGNTVHCFSDSLFCCIGLEMKSTASGGTLNMRRCIIKGNILTNDSTGLAQCILVHDSGPETDPTRIQDIIVEGNDCKSANGGSGGAVISVMGSRMKVRGNNLVHSGTGRAILVNNSTTPQVFYVEVAGNTISSTGTPTQSIIDIFGIGNSVVENNKIYFTGTAAAAVHGIAFSNTCSLISVQNNRIEGVPGAGIMVAGTPSDFLIEGNKIYNCNANSNATANGSGIAWNVTTTGGGNQNIIRGNTIWDDRGTNKMTFGIFSAAASGTIPMLEDNYIDGWLTAPISTSATVFTPHPNVQQGIKYVTANPYQMLPTDSTVVQQTAAGVVFLPTLASLTFAQAGWNYIVKNGSSGTTKVELDAVAVAASKKIDPSASINGGANVTEFDLTNPGQAQGFQIDASGNWLLT